jgi:hypothetical protein
MSAYRLDNVDSSSIQNEIPPDRTPSLRLPRHAVASISITLVPLLGNEDPCVQSCPTDNELYNELARRVF